MTTYAAGLRVSEVVNLKVTDIDSKRMQIRVEQGKGRKDRYALLSEVNLEMLRLLGRPTVPKLGFFQVIITISIIGNLLQTPIPGFGAIIRISRSVYA